MSNTRIIRDILDLGPSVNELITQFQNSENQQLGIKQLSAKYKDQIDLLLTKIHSKIKQPLNELWEEAESTSYRDQRENTMEDSQKAEVITILIKEMQGQDNATIKEKLAEVSKAIAAIQVLAQYGLDPKITGILETVKESIKFALKKETYIPDKDKDNLVSIQDIGKVTSMLEAEAQRLKKEYNISESDFKNIQGKINDMEDSVIVKKRLSLKEVKADNKGSLLSKENRQQIAKDRIEKILFAVSNIRLHCRENKYKQIDSGVLKGILTGLKESMTSTHYFRGWGGDFFNGVRRKLNMGDKVTGKDKIENIIRVIPK